MVSRTSRLLHAALLALCGAGMVYHPTQAQTALTLQVGQPWYYGQISIGNLPPPPVYNPRPILIRPEDGRVRWRQSDLEPVYLRVPEPQIRHWERYCGLYQACGVPVRFVRDDWYRNVYAPRVRYAAAREAREHRHTPYSLGAGLVVTPTDPLSHHRHDPEEGWGRERD